jgi:hypothetical protein
MGHAHYRLSDVTGRHLDAALCNLKALRNAPCDVTNKIMSDESPCATSLHKALTAAPSGECKGVIGCERERVCVCYPWPRNPTTRPSCGR